MKKTQTKVKVAMKSCLGTQAGNSEVRLTNRKEMGERNSGIEDTM